jgi:hypothetical protein
MLAASMADLARLIDEKQRRLLVLEQEALSIRRELQAAKAKLLGHAHIDLKPTNKLIHGNSTAWAETVLRKNGQPMHVNDIIQAIEREFQITVQYATLVGNLSRLVKHGKRFERVGPNTYGLLDWSVEREANELFGRAEYERERVPEEPSRF